ncbi:hypothetical protein E3A20_29120, partial [Planctomyces bekefii]
MHDGSSHFIKCRASLKKDVIYRYSMQGMLVLALTVF